jgi:hypothetical protein
MANPAKTSTFSGAARLQLNHVAEQFSDRHIVRASERPERENNRRQQSVQNCQQ